MEIAKINEIQQLASIAADLPEEVLGVSLDQLDQAIKVLKEYKMTFEYHLIQKMEADEATKMKFINHEKTECLATLSNGARIATKDARELYKQSGYDPEEIGDMVFKPSLKKANEAAKLGKQKKDIIEKIFKPGKKSIKIERI